ETANRAYRLPRAGRFYARKSAASSAAGHNEFVDHDSVDFSSFAPIHFGQRAALVTAADCKSAASDIRGSTPWLPTNSSRCFLPTWWNRQTHQSEMLAARAVPVRVRSSAPMFSNPFVVEQADTLGSELRGASHPGSTPGERTTVFRGRSEKGRRGPET